jgi:protein-tyrosine phosphatase
MRAPGQVRCDGGIEPAVCAGNLRVERQPERSREPDRATHTAMIDLHTHVLPGLDDGARDLEASIEIVRESVASGVTVIAATPHVRDDFQTSASEIRSGAKELRKELARAGIDVELLTGAEISFERLAGLDVRELSALSLAGSDRYLLVETPVYGWPLDASDRIRAVAELGFTVVLGHPERSLVFQQSPALVADLVRRGVLMQVTAASLVGRFGAAAERTGRELVAAGLVHLLASDVHAAGDRGRALTPAIESLRDDALARWLTVDVPMAIVDAGPPPARPQTGTRGRGYRRFLRSTR